MATIVKISVQKKNSQRYNVFLNHGQEEQYAFSVDEAVLAAFGLRKGLELTDAEQSEIIYHDHLRKGYLAAIQYLSYRMRAEQEIEAFLKAKEFQVPAIKGIIKRLNDEGYVNDLEFAKSFVRSRMNLSLKGPQLIKQELMEKGISEQEIDLSLRLFAKDDQLEKIVSAIEKSYAKESKLSKQQQKEKLYQKLKANGFPSDLIWQAFSQHTLEQEQEDSDWQALVYQGEKAIKKYRNEEGWQKRQKLKQYLYRRGFALELIEKFLHQNEHM